MADPCRRIVLLGMGSLSVAGTASAHRQKRTETLVEWTGDGFAITHVFHRHDAEVTLSRAGYLERPDIESLKSRALMAIHVEETFLIEGLVIETLGAETEGNQLFVYQEAKTDALPESLTLQAGMLRGLWGDHVNAVNIKANNETRSVQFFGDDGAKRIALG